MIEVLRAGIVTTVQDLGRLGYRHLGIATAGALDTLALEVGNRLVGNEPHAAAIEISVGMTTLRFTHATRIAVTGAEFEATLDGEPVHAWWSLPIRAGQELAVNGAKGGARVYIAVRGGIDVLPMLGSRATDLGARFGGLGGRALREGDRLASGMPSARRGAAIPIDAPPFGVKAPEWCRFAELKAERIQRRKGTTAIERAALIRVLRGPEYDTFTRCAQESFWCDEWRVTPQSNRMGYRLAGGELARNSRTELLSHAVLPGTIQVPPNGQPIILMRDAQTTGGYPRVGTVIRADLWRLAQVRLNGTIRFVESTREEALFLLRAEKTYLKQIDVALAMQEEAWQRATRAA
jgi:5-oxoprolinase (ATP-hydrolysing) subunit C